MQTFNETEGAVIAGCHIDNNRFIGSIKAALLLKLVGDPRQTEQQKSVDADVQLQDLRMVREAVQRAFTGAKRNNVASYSEYIANMKEGADGITPPITLYSSEQLPVEQDDHGRARMLIPWEQLLVCIDGETQLAARHQARAINAETTKDNVPIYVCHGRPTDWARQAFHDLNNLGVRQNTNMAAGMDARDPMNKLCRQIEDKVPWLKGRINKRLTNLKPKHTELLTFLALRTFVSTLAKGAGGVQYGSKPVPMNPEHVATIERTAIAFLEALHEAFPAACSDRITKVLLNPTIFGSLGALATDLVHESDPGKLEAGLKTILEVLRPINWEKGAPWVSVAGRYTKDGKVSFGGAKQSIYSVLTALRDPAAPTYQEIRKPAAQLELPVDPAQRLIAGIVKMRLLYPC